jgi:hypothetical protein
VSCHCSGIMHRFCRPFTEVSFTSENAGAKNVECEFCAALRRARELEVFDPLPQLCSPLTPGVQLANLSYDWQILRVALDTQWKRMFEQLPLAGEALVMTRNQAAPRTNHDLSGTRIHSPRIQGR